MREDKDLADQALDSNLRTRALDRRTFLMSALRVAGGGLASTAFMSEAIFAESSGVAEMKSQISNYAAQRAAQVDYVSEPRPADTSYLIGALNFPGWENRNGKSPWDPIRSFPDRRPILGYYDGTSPAVADWEIKWALENGISYFTYCWYRKEENVGQPVTDSGLFLQNAIHEGLFKAKYVDRFKFAIMWTNRKVGGVSSEQDFLNHLLPFWMDNYFQHPSYLKIDGMPVLYIYGPEPLVKDLGGVEQTKTALDRARAALRSRGFPGLLVFGEYHGQDLTVMARNRAAGFDVQFAYAVGPPWGGTTASDAPLAELLRPTPEEAIMREVDYMKAWENNGAIPFVPTASMGWDPMPWSAAAQSRGHLAHGPRYMQPDTMTRWRLSPEQFQTTLQRMKELMATLPPKSLGRKMLLLDNWNEWGEGHFIAPHAGGGFGYLKAVRDVFTRCDNKPDYRSPFELGLGPYNLPEPQ